LEGDDSCLLEGPSAKRNLGKAWNLRAKCPLTRF